MIKELPNWSTEEYQKCHQRTDSIVSHSRCLGNCDVLMYSGASVQRPQGLVNLVVDPMVDRGPRMDIKQV